MRAEVPVRRGRCAARGPGSARWVRRSARLGRGRLGRLAARLGVGSGSDRRQGRRSAADRRPRSAERSARRSASAGLGARRIAGRRCRGRCRCRCRGRRRLLTPEVLPQGQAAAPHLGRLGPAHVAVVPRLVRVAGDARLALRVGHHEAVFPGVLLEPGTGLGRAPVASNTRPPIRRSSGSRRSSRAGARCARPGRST